MKKNRTKAISIIENIIEPLLVEYAEMKTNNVQKELQKGLNGERYYNVEDAIVAVLDR